MKCESCHAVGEPGTVCMACGRGTHSVPSTSREAHMTREEQRIAEATRRRKAAQRRLARKAANKAANKSAPAKPGADINGNK